MDAVNALLSRDVLTRQTLGARTLPDIEAAKQALREWIAAHPEDEGMRDGFEQLSHMEDIARERAALPPEQIEWQRRHDCLLNFAQSATTPSEVAMALQDINAWLTVWPADETMLATREQIKIMQEFLDNTPAVDTRPLQAAV